jgi:hypothetical protein
VRHLTRKYCQTQLDLCFAVVFFFHSLPSRINCEEKGRHETSSIEFTRAASFPIQKHLVEREDGNPVKHYVVEHITPTTSELVIRLFSRSTSPFDMARVEAALGTKKQENESTTTRVHVREAGHTGGRIFANTQANPPRKKVNQDHSLACLDRIELQLKYLYFDDEDACLRGDLPSVNQFPWGGYSYQEEERVAEFGGHNITDMKSEHATGTLPSARLTNRNKCNHIGQGSHVHFQHNIPGTRVVSSRETREVIKKAGSTTRRRDQISALAVQDRTVCETQNATELGTLPPSDKHPISTCLSSPVFNRREGYPSSIFCNLDYKPIRAKDGEEGKMRDDNSIRDRMQKVKPQKDPKSQMRDDNSIRVKMQKVKPQKDTKSNSVHGGDVLSIESSLKNGSRDCKRNSEALVQGDDVHPNKQRTEVTAPGRCIARRREAEPIQDLAPTGFEVDRDALDIIFSPLLAGKIDDQREDKVTEQTPKEETGEATSHLRPNLDFGEQELVASPSSPRNRDLYAYQRGVNDKQSLQLSAASETGRHLTAEAVAGTPNKSGGVQTIAKSDTLCHHKRAECTNEGRGGNSREEEDQTTNFSDMRENDKDETYERTKSRARSANFSPPQTPNASGFLTQSGDSSYMSDDFESSSSTDHDEEPKLSQADY